MYLPNFDEPIKIETNTSLKVKNLKDLIKERGADHHGLKDISADRLQLQIEGGAVLKKNSALLDDAGIRDRTNLIVSILEKGAVGT